MGPLNIGSAIYRLVSRLIAIRFTKLVGEKLAPLQFCIGVPGGVESNAAITETCYYNNLDVVSVDLKNGCNLIPRSLVYKQLKSLCPVLLPYFVQTHGKPSNAYCLNGFKIGTVEQGVRQGDPMASLFFSVGIQGVLQLIQQKVRNVVKDQPSATIA